MTIKKIKIVSRKSKLALRQSEIVKQQLKYVQPSLNVEIIGISTSGDELLATPLNKIGGKGLFVSELEQYLLTGKADLAVHSMKDMPALMPEDLQIGAILKRADPRDVFISTKYTDVRQLPEGALVGTSSLRRQAQVLALNKKVEIDALRGNVETRVQKLLDQEYDAIILAYAGLERLGLQQWLRTPLPLTDMLPAVGQGAIGVQYMHANQELKTLLEKINHAETSICVSAERAMNALMNGGCQAPIAGYAMLVDTELELHALVAIPDGSVMLSEVMRGTREDPEGLGSKVAQKLIARGALEIIAKAKAQQQSW